MSENKSMTSSHYDRNGNLIIRIPNFIQYTSNFITSSPNDISHLFKISFISHEGQPLYVDNPNVLRDVLRKYCLYKKMSGKIELPMSTAVKIAQAVKNAERIKETDNTIGTENINGINVANIPVKNTDAFEENGSVEEANAKTDSDANKTFKTKRVTIVENLPPVRTYDSRTNLSAIQEAENEDSSPILSIETIQPLQPPVNSPELSTNSAENIEPPSPFEETSVEETPTEENLQPDESLPKTSTDEPTEPVAAFKKTESISDLLTFLDISEQSSLKLSTEEEVQSLVSYLRMSVEGFLPEEISPPIKYFSSFTQVSWEEEPSISTSEAATNTDTIRRRKKRCIIS